MHERGLEPWLLGVVRELLVGQAGGDHGFPELGEGHRDVDPLAPGRLRTRLTRCSSPGFIEATS
jgi:hypothetical protein